MSLTHNPRSRQGARTISPRWPWAALLLPALFLTAWMAAQGQQPPLQPGQPPQQAGQPPQPGQPPAQGGPIARAAVETPLPVDEDPNDPNASPEERLRRQKVIIMKRIEQRQKMMAAQQQAAEQAETQAQQQQSTPPPAPGVRAPVQPAQPGQPAPAQHGLQGRTGSAGKAEPAVTMYLVPASIITQPGKRFTTRCDLINADHLRVDTVEIALSYPANTIKLLGIHQDKIRPMIAGQPECEVDEARGAVFYKIRLVRPVNAIEIPTVTFAWEAVAPTDAAEIKLTEGERLSRVLGEGKILTTNMAGPESAVLGSFLRVDPADTAGPRGIRFFDIDNSQLMQAGFRDQSRLRPPSLWIRQPEGGELLAPGRWFVVDIGIDNPDGVVFDELRLAATFDPASVEISDADRGNWISDGVNLLDGPFHEQWPWDCHFRNEVNPRLGYFYYHVGMTDLREQPSGAVARLFVRVKRPTSGPLFSWIVGERKDPTLPSTGIYRFNRNLYQKLIRGGAGEAEPAKTADSLKRDLAPGMEKADPALYRVKPAAAKKE